MKSKGRSETKSVTFDNEEEPITSFQQRLETFWIPPWTINPISLQQYSKEGRDQGAYARYRGGGRGRGRGPGRGSRKFQGYLDIINIYP